MCTIPQIYIEDTILSITKNNKVNLIFMNDMAEIRKGDNRVTNIIKNRIRKASPLIYWIRKILQNHNFKPVEFDTIRNQARLNISNLAPIIESKRHVR